MAQQTPVLYGNRLYSKATYSTNADPETFNINLSDSVGSADSLTNQATKPLLDTLSLLDAYITSMSVSLADTSTLSETFEVAFSKALADSVIASDSLTKTISIPTNDLLSLTENVAFQITKVINDSLGMTDNAAKEVSKILSDFINTLDNPIIVNLTTALNDILLLQDWVSIRLLKPNIWTVSKTVIPTSTLYGRFLYGITPYSGISVRTWIDIKPSVTNNGWKSFNQLQLHS